MSTAGGLLHPQKPWHPPTGRCSPWLQGPCCPGRGAGGCSRLLRVLQVQQGQEEAPVSALGHRQQQALLQGSSQQLWAHHQQMWEARCMSAVKSKRLPSIILKERARPGERKPLQLPLQRQALVRFRVGRHPLRIATGRNEGMAVPTHSQVKHRGRGGAWLGLWCRRGSRGHAALLLDCPFYATVGQSWDEAFGQQATTASVLGQRDHCRLAAIVSRMLQRREQFLQGGDA